MKFRTEIKDPCFPFKISHEDKVMFIGSCFSEHIGNYFQSVGFDTYNNPFGILFNPESIYTALQLALDPSLFQEKHIYYHQGKWLSWLHHGKFSEEEKGLFLEKIDQQLKKTETAIREIDYLFVTFGTAFYYSFIPENLIVANCHKVNNKMFEKKRVEIDSTFEKYQEMFQKLHQINPKLKIVMTVSPIRHLGEGFHENQVSKSILHLIIDRLVDQENIFYFPSYEIIMDDLRDYRFYDHDLCHVNTFGINYIKEKVSDFFFETHTKQRCFEIEKKQQFSAHIPRKLFQKNQNNEKEFYE